MELGKENFCSLLPPPFLPLARGNDLLDAASAGRTNFYCECKLHACDSTLLLCVTSVMLCSVEVTVTCRGEE